MNVDDVGMGGAPDRHPDLFCALGGQLVDNDRLLGVCRCEEPSGE
ncbi:MAG TPA: hypothetical protein VE465_03395 [Streptosporangiaceae bacterium]|nr:hypothetical protein [Streptosporangiaceae bacterium]